MNFNTPLTLETKYLEKQILFLLRKRDITLHKQADELMRDYMIKIGAYEQEVLTAELDLSLLHKKAELIRAALNRREKPDLNAIEEVLKKEREARLKEIEQNCSNCLLGDLDPEEMEELHELYLEIIRTYNPNGNANFTQNDADLYRQAIEAYKHKDLVALRAIRDILRSHKEFYDSLASRFDYTLMKSANGWDYSTDHDINYEEDFVLANLIRKCFEKTEFDIMISCRAESARERLEAINNEIKELQEQFPFTAQETLASKAKTAQYIADLKTRMEECRQETAEIEQTIEKMFKR